MFIAPTRYLLVDAGQEAPVPLLHASSSLSLSLSTAEPRPVSPHASPPVAHAAGGQHRRHGACVLPLIPRSTGGRPSLLSLSLSFSLSLSLFCAAAPRARPGGHVWRGDGADGPIPPGSASARVELKE
ncbi:hypothetical protein GUJ93_ZPchr0012g21677 [Zizania palustris]|uniref:Uncharacterized protein n=1 Tax=Zizania palustris TaxID=103762 RepID=A0A8J5WN73_ZIZPA|nr:hypothetical protein GUJ93_ZPchr0012g21677 [Zizania palustris]